MPSTNKTKYGLSQFDGEDRLKRSDYNNDMKIIDEELDKKANKTDYIENSMKTFTGENNKIPVINSNGCLVIPDMLIKNPTVSSSHAVGAVGLKFGFQSETFDILKAEKATNNTTSLSLFTEVGYNTSKEVLKISPYGNISGPGISTTGEANKIFKWGNIDNTFLDIFKIRKTSENAFKVSNDNGTEIFNIDSKNGVLSGIAADKKLDNIKYENNIKVIQGVPEGGQKYFDSEITGGIKIKLPVNKSSSIYSFLIHIRDNVSNNNVILRIIGNNVSAGVGSSELIKTNHKATIISDSFNSDSISEVSFYTGVNQDYLIIGTISDTWKNLSVVVKDIQYTGTDDWTSNWNISIITELEDITDTFFTTVTPCLNATHLGGTESTSFALLESPIFTGTPTSPTAVSGTNNSQIATTAFAHGILEKGANGYTKLPNGLIIQWFFTQLTIGTSTVLFPITFPSTCFGAIGNPSTSGTTAPTGLYPIGFNNQSFIVNSNYTGQSFFIAIGY